MYGEDAESALRFLYNAMAAKAGPPVSVPGPPEADLSGQRAGGQEQGFPERHGRHPNNGQVEGKGRAAVQDGEGSARNVLPLPQTETERQATLMDLATDTRISSFRICCRRCSVTVAKKDGTGAADALRSLRKKIRAMRNQREHAAQDLQREQERRQASLAESAQRTAQSSEKHKRLIDDRACAERLSAYVRTMFSNAFAADGEGLHSSGHVFNLLVGARQ